MVRHLLMAPCLLLAVFTFLLSSGHAISQSASTSEGTINVTGRVVNAITGATIPRALVNLNGRAVLTDSLGHFVFPAFQPIGQGSSIQAYAQVTKPGFASAADPTEGGGQQLSNITDPVELKLYPDGLITGTLTGSDGDPLGRIQVALFRMMADENSERLQQVGVTMTDSRGEYRFEEEPGRYALLVRYSPRGGDAGQAVLPQRYPADTATSSQAAFPLSSGAEQKIDLPLQTGPAYPVIIKVESRLDRPPTFVLSARTGSGESFTLYAGQGRAPGEFHIDLPLGTYTLHANLPLRDQSLEAESRVTITGHTLPSLTLHFVDVPSIPIQVVLDTSTAGSSTGLQATEGVQPQPPTPTNLNLRFQKVGDATLDGNDALRITTRADKSFAVNAGTGTYRLTAQSNGQWYILRATYGTTDLFTHNLTVGSGAGGESIQLAVSSAFGAVEGTVRKDGVAVSGWVYLLPHDASLVAGYVVRVGRDGGYTKQLPPGTYTVVALDHQVPGELRDPEVQTKLERGSTTTRVTVGGVATVDLDQQPLEKVE